MAKKSAMSKGYRKTVKKKPFLSKKEIIELIVIVAVILLGIILFNVFYDDGFIKADAVQQGDIVAYASSDLRDRYFKVGTIGEMEGYTLNERAEGAAPIEGYVFTPDGEADHVTSFSVSGSFVGAEMLASTTQSYMSDIDSTFSAIEQTTIQDHDAYVFSYNYSEYDATLDAEATEEAATEEAAAETEEEPAHNKFSQNLTAYVEVDEGHTLCLHIYRKGEDESFYLADDQIVDYVQQFSSSFTLPVEEA
jgi:hypothetical protein